MNGVWLNQTDAAQALGISVNAFHTRKRKILDNGQRYQKKRYFIPCKQMTVQQRKKYSQEVIDLDENDVEFPEMPVEEVVSDFTDIQLKSARLKKIVKETQLLSQKILSKKEQMFIQWTQRFFTVFEKSFTKFKNSLIQLHLGAQQLKKLNENLEYAIKNMDISLNEIYSEYMEQETTQE